ncbi:MAG: c-type cytochrome [Candidatus Binataceae bacterium]
MATIATLGWMNTTAVAACVGGAIRQAVDSQSKVASTRATARATNESRAEVKKLYATRCAVCHGTSGRGDGPGAGNLDPKPPNFCNLDWQRSITDEKISRAIVYGGAAVGLTSQMAPNPDLEDQPAVVAAFVEHIRRLGSKSQ